MWAKYYITILIEKLQYYGKIVVGENNRILTVEFDTGSSV